KRTCRSAVFGGWRKLRARLARIGIDAEQKEFHRNRAEVDGAIRQQFWRFVRLECCVLVGKIARGRWRKDHIDRLIHLTFDWLQRDHARLPDRRGHPTARPQAVALARQTHLPLHSPPPPPPPPTPT